MTCSSSYIFCKGRPHVLNMAMTMIIITRPHNPYNSSCYHVILANSLSLLKSSCPLSELDNPRNKIFVFPYSSSVSNYWAGNVHESSEIHSIKGRLLFQAQHLIFFSTQNIFVSLYWSGNKDIRCVI